MSDQETASRATTLRNILASFTDATAGAETVAESGWDLVHADRGCLRFHPVQAEDAILTRDILNRVATGASPRETYLFVCETLQQFHAQDAASDDDEPVDGVEVGLGTRRRGLALVEKAARMTEYASMLLIDDVKFVHDKLMEFVLGLLELFVSFSPDFLGFFKLTSPQKVNKKATDSLALALACYIANSGALNHPSAVPTNRVQKARMDAAATGLSADPLRSISSFHRFVKVCTDHLDFSTLLASPFLSPSLPATHEADASSLTTTTSVLVALALTGDHLSLFPPNTTWVPRVLSPPRLWGSHATAAKHLTACLRFAHDAGDTPQGELALVWACGMLGYVLARLGADEDTNGDDGEGGEGVFEPLVVAWLACMAASSHSGAREVLFEHLRTFVTSDAVDDARKGIVVEMMLDAGGGADGVGIRALGVLMIKEVISDAATRNRGGLFGSSFVVERFLDRVFDLRSKVWRLEGQEFAEEKETFAVEWGGVLGHALNLLMYLVLVSKRQGRDGDRKSVSHVDHAPTLA
ncbi:hypothetical protein HK101_001738 [Irineochytrium annulatum]|nr:hypothetical protein HK101_001738 [Irineochytrium annulatum]